MMDIKSSLSMIILDEEIDRLVFLCTHIAQISSHIRIRHLMNISYSMENIQSSYDSLLSMAEDIEGSAILLESLLATQQRCLVFNQPKRSTRIHYTKEKLLQLRYNVTVELSNDIGDLLRKVVERESNDSVESERKSWRDIRTILM